MRTPLLLVAVIGCGSPREAVPQNVAPPSPSVHVAPTDPLGWLAVAPLAKRDDDDDAPGWLPVDAHAVIVPGAPGGLPHDLTGVPSRGEPVHLTTGAAEKIRYGCDQNQLAIVPLAGGRVAPGVVWLLPASVPVTWSPRAIAIRSAQATATHRRYTAGPLTIELSRPDPLHGALAILRDGRTVHAATFERPQMDGADLTLPLDLASEGPGIPSPVGAWSVAPGGPVLLVLSQPGFEGTTLVPLLIDDAAAHALDAMSLYLYQCAF